jgi:hypothetical protein
MSDAMQHIVVAAIVACAAAFLARKAWRVLRPGRGTTCCGARECPAAKAMVAKMEARRRQ